MQQHALAMLPKITVVTPTYNRAEYLEETIRSVLDQNYPNLEYIIVDGGSTNPQVIDLIRRYEHRLAWWISERDGGHAEAIGKGFARATGEVLAWLCSDDTYLPGALRAVGETFRGHPDADVVYGHYNVIDSRSRVVRNGRVVKYSRLQMLSNGNVHQASVFWTRKIYHRAGAQVGGVRLEYNRYSPDSDLYYRFIRAGARWRMLPSTLSTFRVHRNHTTSLEPREVWNHYWKAAREHYPFWTRTGAYRALAAAMRLRRTFYLIRQGDARYLLARLARTPLSQ